MGNKKRGSGTHGHGSSKKRRGAGNRGGRGKAGKGKKAKHKKIQAVKRQYLGETGFTRPQGREVDETGINLRDIDERIDEFLEAGVAEEDNGSFVFYAERAGYDKVLGAGRLTRDIDVVAPAFSAAAEAAIEENGNTATVE